MDTIRLERLRQVVFERLTLGESREALHKDLCRKLEDGAALEIVDAAVREIAARRADGNYDADACRTRKRRFAADYLAWRILAGVLIVVGIAGSLAGILESQTLTVAIGPLAVGGLILGIVGWKVNSRMLAAKEAVDLLFEREPAASA